MTVKEILKLLEAKNQNLPKIKISSDIKKHKQIILTVFEGEEKAIVKKYQCLKKEKISGKAGEITELICKDCICHICGLGKRNKITPRIIRRFFGRLYLSRISIKPKEIAILLPDKIDLQEWSKLASLGIHVSALNSSILKSKQDKKPVPTVFLVHPGLTKSKSAVEKAIKQGQITAEGKNLMRILGVLPPNILNTQKYAEVIQKLAKQWKVPCKRVSQKALKKYNLLNTVSDGSKNNSELLVLTMHPKNGKTKKAVAVVGKGLCYDSGGLQGKQNFMKFMKEDMAGSGSVLGAILDIVKNKRKLKETTHFLLPLAENMMGSNAMRADDIITAGDGQTVEISNTDAEGRLVMADAICYAKNNFKNIHSYMTIATLTGSCIIALGSIYTGIVCNNKSLAERARKSGLLSGDLIHPAPWDEEYDDNNSPQADMCNIGEKDREASWIKAGMFLYRFIPKAKKESENPQFCHFDIAGSIDMEEKGVAWRKKGFSSGVGVGLLSNLLVE